ncbi:MAG: alpha/beta fold hydrolase [Crocinitomicaceae bacterium]|nr:alpha/beta fold hydrolase [Crocinitomicaceae bacterium]
MKYFFLLLTGLLLWSNSSVFAQKHEGHWLGQLNVSGALLPIVFHIVKENGSYSGTMDSPQQNAFGFPFKEVKVTADEISLDLPGLGINYTGKWVNDSLKGKFNQGGKSYDLNLARMKTDTYEKPKRPQEELGKIKYIQEEVTFFNAEAKIKLAGTWTKPKGKGPFPAVILVSGSGPQDRNEEIMGHKPFLVIADYLTNNGIAVLRYDDRGVGKSTGEFVNATTADFATDVAAGIAFLKQQKGIDKNKIGIIGHSEGGMIAPMVAAKDSTIDFIVLLAGPGIFIRDLMLQQQEDILISENTEPAEIQSQIELNRKAFEIILNNPDNFDAKNKLFKMYQAIDSSQTESEIRSTTNELVSPWFRYFITYNPQIALEQTTCSVLAINGDKDLQVASKPNLKGIETALKAGGNKDFKIVEMPNMNHLFQTSSTGNIAEYGQLEETFSPKVLELMKNWILEK